MPTIFWNCGPKRYFDIRRIVVQLPLSCTSWKKYVQTEMDSHNSRISFKMSSTGWDRSEIPSVHHIKRRTHIAHGIVNRLHKNVNQKLPLVSNIWEWQKDWKGNKLNALLFYVILNWNLKKITIFTVCIHELNNTLNYPFSYQLLLNILPFFYF